MKQNVIKDKSFNFSLRIIKLSQFLQESKKEYILSKQIMRSGTSIGALIREALQAESKADFIHKLSISQKEAAETEYWLELVYKSDFIDENQYSSLITDLTELIKMLASIIITTKKSINKL